jgi:hypothetical protein
MPLHRSRAHYFPIFQLIYCGCRQPRGNECNRAGWSSIVNLAFAISRSRDRSSRAPRRTCNRYASGRRTSICKRWRHAQCRHVAHMPMQANTLHSNSDHPRAHRPLFLPCDGSFSAVPAMYLAVFLCGGRPRSFRSSSWTADQSEHQEGNARWCRCRIYNKCHWTGTIEAMGWRIARFDWRI